MTKKKKQSVYQLDTQQYLREHGWAKPLKERYPQVSSIKIDVHFKDADVWPGDPDPKVLNFAPEQKAFFLMRCPYRECVRGGFDFSSGVQEAINSPSFSSEGRVTCDGWQDEQRINRHRCSLAASYKVSVEHL